MRVGEVGYAEPVETGRQCPCGHKLYHYADNSINFCKRCDFEEEYVVRASGARWRRRT